jgi:hypothetical protein
MNLSQVWILEMIPGIFHQIIKKDSSLREVNSHFLKQHFTIPVGDEAECP